MAVTSSELDTIFQTQLQTAQTFQQNAQDALGPAFAVFSDPTVFQYTPYAWNTDQAPVISWNPTYQIPQRAVRPSLPKDPELIKYPEPLKNVDFEKDKPAAFTTLPPSITFPVEPSGEPTDSTGAVPTVYSPVFPGGPQLLALPSSTLPYPTVTVPPAPDLVMPVFDGAAPSDIQPVSLQEYLDLLTSSYDKYSQDLPDLVAANWMKWFSLMLDARPLIAKLSNTISTYIDNGGSGIPVPIEEAIVTRATDRVTAEQRRATVQVYEDVAKRGLVLPSGALLAGLKGARQTAAEANSKVATDIAIKNLELEHDHMKFMMNLGVELERWVLNFASDTAKSVIEVNSQAIDLTKTILTGMIEVNNIIVRIYLAKWEGYKAAADVYRSRISALEAQIRLYEAEIRAELAKVEINKAVVEVLTAIVNANRALVEQYKVAVDAETSKVEASRVQVLAFEASVRAYAARVEAYRAKWEGFRAATEGQVAKSRVYESQVQAYTARVNAWRAEIEGYEALIKGQAQTIDAISRQNEALLKEYTVEVSALLDAYKADIAAYGANWNAIAEQLRGDATAVQILGEFVLKSYQTQIQIDTERAREHLSEWRSVLEATLQAGNGLTQVAQVQNNMAASALNGLTAFAGGLATTAS